MKLTWANTYSYQASDLATIYANYNHSSAIKTT